jgi:hypothetical protein
VTGQLGTGESVDVALGVGVGDGLQGGRDGGVEILPQPKCWNNRLIKSTRYCQNCWCHPYALPFLPPCILRPLAAEVFVWAGAMVLQGITVGAGEVLGFCVGFGDAWVGFGIGVVGVGCHSFVIVGAGVG